MNFNDDEYLYEDNEYEEDLEEDDGLNPEEDIYEDYKEDLDDYYN